MISSGKLTKNLIKMKTPILDEFIEELQELKDDNFFLTKDLEERLIEFKNIKAAINYTHSCTELKCDCGNTEDVKNIPICASCYNPHTGEW